MPTLMRARELYGNPTRILPPDLSDPVTVARLSAEAVQVVNRIVVGSWGLTIEQACTLMGGINHSTYKRRLNAPGKVRLNVDELTRASLIVGIYRALNTLYSAPLPDKWMKIKNNNPLFAGVTPLEHAQTRGIIGLTEIRALLDGFRGGI